MRKPKPADQLPRLIDSYVSGSPGDYSAPGLGMEFSYGGIVLVPPGEIEFHHIGVRHMFDLHGDVDRCAIGIDSDRLSHFRPTPDSTGFIPSGCSFKIDLVNSRLTSVIAVDPEWMSQLADDAFGVGTVPSAPLAYHYDASMHDLKTRLAREASAQAPDLLVIENSVTALCLRLFEILTQRRLPEKGTHRLHAAMFRAIDLAETSLGGKIRIAELAREAGLSHYHFIRIFQDVFGETPLDYIRRRRLERAMDALRGSKLSIAEIALDCGFSSQSHLTDSMRAKHMTTPAQYRASFV
jgi:AraC-like DNA-binding protein